MTNSMYYVFTISDRRCAPGGNDERLPGDGRARPAATTINIRRSEITLRERKSPLCAKPEVRYVVCISWLELQGSTARPTREGGQWHIFVQTSLGLSFALEFLPTFWLAGGRPRTWVATKSNKRLINSLACSLLPSYVHRRTSSFLLASQWRKHLPRTHDERLHAHSTPAAAAHRSR